MLEGWREQAETQAAYGTCARGSGMHAVWGAHGVWGGYGVQGVYGVWEMHDVACMQGVEHASCTPETNSGGAQYRDVPKRSQEPSNRHLVIQQAPQHEFN